MCRYYPHNPNLSNEYTVDILFRYPEYPMDKMKTVHKRNTAQYRNYIMKII